MRKKLSLAPRETEIADLVSSGLRNQEVADRLGISPKTVRNSLVLMYAKAGVRNRVEFCMRWKGGA